MLTVIKPVCPEFSREGRIDEILEKAIGDTEVFPQLDGRAVYADYPIPENNKFKQDAKCRASGEHRHGGRHNHHAEPDVP